MWQGQSIPGQFLTEHTDLYRWNTRSKRLTTMVVRNARDVKKHGFMTEYRDHWP